VIIGGFVGSRPSEQHRNRLLRGHQGVIDRVASPSGRGTSIAPSGGRFGGEKLSRPARRCDPERFCRALSCNSPLATRRCTIRPTLTSDTRQAQQPEDPVEFQLRDLEARLITQVRPAGVPAARVRAAVRDAAPGSQMPRCAPLFR
jgi:hypothetical protein